MANRTQTYLTSDWKIWGYETSANLFILGFSKLDGSDVLGGTAEGWGTFGELDYSITGIELSTGQSAEAFSTPTITPPNLTVVLSVKDFTVDDLKNLVIGKPLHLTHKNAQSVDKDPIYGFNTPYFMGFITDVQVELVPGDLYSTVTISAITSFENMLNSQITMTKDTVTDKSNFFRLNLNVPSYSEQFQFGSVNSEFYFAGAVTETKSVGEWLADHISCELTVPAFSTAVGANSSGILSYSSACIISPYSAGKPVVSHTFTENEIIGADTAFIGANNPTSVALSLYSNSAITYKYTNESGNYVNRKVLATYSGTLDVANSAQLTIIGQRMVNIETGATPIAIQVELATNNQSLEFVERLITVSGTPTSYWLYPKQYAVVGSRVNVDMTDFGYDTKTMFICGSQMTVTPDNWVITYNLWKGF